MFPRYSIHNEKFSMLKISTTQLILFKLCKVSGDVTICLLSCILSFKMFVFFNKINEDSTLYSRCINEDSTLYSRCMFCIDMLPMLCLLTYLINRVIYRKILATDQKYHSFYCSHPHVYILQTKIS